MLDGIIKTPLKKINLDDGSVFHGMKKNDIGFVDFGEVYFSFINKDAIKGWKLHKKMTLNLIAPIGEIKFNFIDFRPDSKTYNSLFEINLSEKDYCRLTVPPNIWFAFKGVGEGINMLTNIADISHDPNEVLRKELNEIQFSDK
jgi:dTDP-4-dehydrorhamnose 3,5-epimerase